jgi:dipeptidyl aminopeptidase/acylaminoacyl peptidase
MILALPAITAAAAPPPQVIVFARTIGDSQLLFSIRPDGSSFRRLTRGGSNESEPVLSPDGRLIAAVGAGGIVIRARDGRLVRRTRVVVGSQLTEPRWSPGGRWIAFLAERCESPRDYGPVCADLWIVRPTSGVRRRLSRRTSRRSILRPLRGRPGGNRSSTSSMTSPASPSCRFRAAGPGSRAEPAIRQRPCVVTNRLDRVRPAAWAVPRIRPLCRSAERVGPTAALPRRKRGTTGCLAGRKAHRVP